MYMNSALPLWAAREEHTVLTAKLQRLSQPSSEYFLLLATATVIASVGLFQNSAAVVIGSMIIAPLLGPLMSLSFGAVTADLPLLRRSTFTLIGGSLVGVLIAYLVAIVFHSIELTPEILARTHPTLLDLAIAISAGGLAAYCQTKERLADTLSGVAIAVALVPPLSVVGIGLAQQSTAMVSGAALLYVTNMVAIVMSGSMAFVIMGYAPLQKAKHGLAIAAAIVALLAIPLGLNMHKPTTTNEVSRTTKMLMES